MTGLEIGWLKYATRPRVMEEARRGERGPGGRGKRGRMQKSECTPRDTRRWNGSTRYLITYFAKLRQRRRRRSSQNRSSSGLQPPTHPSRHPPSPEPAARRSFPSHAVYSYESFSAPLWNLDSARARGAELVRHFSFSETYRLLLPASRFWN